MLFIHHHSTDPYFNIATPVRLKWTPMSKKASFKQ